MAKAEPKKTKAKQHYLKAKRQRRKKRLKATAVRTISVKNKAQEKQKAISGQREERERLDELSQEDTAVSSEESENDSGPKIVSTQHGSNQRPKKRRKLSEASSFSSTSSSSSHSETSGAMSTLESPNQPVLPPSALPTFEMPAAEDMGTLEELALQGLDPGLLSAEIVDSAKTAPLDMLSSGSLNPKTRKRLKDLGITELFAVQTTLLPFLLSKSNHFLYMPYNPPRDVCVSAPTGSGKTLAYVIPILELLSTRIVVRLRALIVLPTRDLVTQVRETFEALCKGRGLKMASVTGQHSFTHEQSQLVDESDIPLRGGSSKVDILICTPGRLIDHLKGTKNFTLQHLRFLVIDEADRLLAQSFQDWLTQVLQAIRPPTPSSTSSMSPNSDSNILPYHDALAPAWQPYPSWRTHLDSPREPSCQKLLFSATLTRDPAKIAALELRDAKYFIVSDSASKHKMSEGRNLVAGDAFAFPTTLSEYMLICTSYFKPLMLFYLIHKRGVSNALVFTKSTESTSRLVKLFGCFEDALDNNSNRPVVRAYSSDLSPSERKAIFEKFKAQEITVLICSDLISRGIDIDHVNHVISYDAPVDIRKYVHRVGRTARAGRSGDAWSLVEEQEARYFKKMMASADHLDKVKKVNVPERELQDLKLKYEIAMEAYNGKSREGDARSIYNHL